MSTVIEAREGPLVITEDNGSSQVVVLLGENTAQARAEHLLAEAAREGAETAEANAAANAATAITLRESLSSVQTIGRPDGGTMSTGANSLLRWHVFADPVESGSGTQLTTLRMWQATAGTISIAFWSKSGDTFTKVGSNTDVVLTDIAAVGTTDLTSLDILVPEGATHIGVLPSAAGVLRQVTATADGDGWFRGAADGDVSPFSDVATETGVQLQIGFDFNKQVVTADDYTAYTTATDASIATLQTDKFSTRSKLLAGAGISSLVRERELRYRTRGQEESDWRMGLLIARIAAGTSATALKTVYVAPAAAGTGDGTSEANAATLATLPTLNPGDTVLLTDGTYEPIELLTLPHFVTFDADPANSARPHFEGRTFFDDWTKAATGKFTRTMTTRPDAVSYNLQQDDATGTVTALRTDNPRSAFLRKLSGRDETDFRAWYGWLPEAAVDTASPANDTFSWLSNTLTVQLADDPDLATFEATCGVTERRQALLRVGASSAPLRGFRIRNIDFRHYGQQTATGSTPTNGYGIRTTGCEQSLIEGCNFTNMGYHAAFFAASSTVNNTIRDCFAFGLAINDADGLNPFGFYTAETGSGLLFGNHIGERLYFEAIPPLGRGGAPVVPVGTGFAPYLGYSHGARDMAGVQWIGCWQHDRSTEINDATSGALVPAGKGWIEGDFSAEDHVNFATEDPLAIVRSCPVEVIGGGCFGASATVAMDVVFYDTVENRTSYVWDGAAWAMQIDGTVSDTLCVLSESSIGHLVAKIGGYWRPGKFLDVFTAVASDDRLVLADGVQFYFDSTTSDSTLGIMFRMSGTATQPCAYLNGVVINAASSSNLKLFGVASPIDLATIVARLQAAISSDGTNVFGSGIPLFYGSTSVSSAFDTAASGWTANISALDTVNASSPTTIDLTA